MGIGKQRNETQQGLVTLDLIHGRKENVKYKLGVPNMIHKKKK